MLRYLTLCLASAVTLLALALMTDNWMLAEKAQAQTQTPQMQGDLLVESRTADSIAGVYGYAGSTVIFTSRFDRSERAVSTKLVVNGNAWRYEEDQDAGTWSYSRADNALSIADQDALIALMVDLGLTDIAAEENAPEQESTLYGTTLFLTEAPVGYEMPVITSETETEGPTARTATTPVSWSAEDVRTEETASECEDLEVLGGLDLVASACQRDDNDDSGPNYPGVDYLTCETKNRGASYDWTRKCFNTYTSFSGPKTTKCIGRCGATCKGSNNNNGTYTQDCLDHDKCVRDAGTRLAPGCGDEFREVARDAQAPHNCRS